YLHLATRPLLPQRDSATPIEADDVKPVLADIDTDGGDHTLQDLRHGVLLSFGASCQPTCRQGQEHGRTIPLADFALSIGPADVRKMPLWEICLMTFVRLRRDIDLQTDQKLLELRAVAK